MVKATAAHQISEKAMDFLTQSFIERRSIKIEETSLEDLLHGIIAMEL